MNNKSTNPYVRYLMTPCYGWNPRTRKSVGSRHRWDGIICRWCGRFKDQCLKRISR